MPRNRKKFYTQDNADFIVGFIQGAKKYHGVEIDFCGIWNETMLDVPWIKLLRKTLDRHGLSRVRIVAADQNTDIWNIVDPLNRDAELNKAVHAVGVHYPGWAGPDHAGRYQPACRQGRAASRCGRARTGRGAAIGPGPVPWRKSTIGTTSTAG